MAASLPPVSMTSASPYWMVRRAVPIAWLAEAQAEATPQLGPPRPCAIAIWPAAAFSIILGTKKGLIRPGPFSLNFLSCSCISVRPPIPLAMIAPQRKRSSFEKSIRESSTAPLAAATAYWAKGSIRLASFESMYWPGSKFFSSAAKVTECPLVSNLVILAAPLCPESRAFQYASMVLPTGVRTPIPVMTTLFLVAGILLDIADGVAHGLDFFGGVVGDGEIEGVFDFHDQLHSVKRVGAQVVYERGGLGDLLLGHSELLGNNLDDLGLDFGGRRHRSSVNGEPYRAPVMGRDYMDPVSSFQALSLQR